MKNLIFLTTFLLPFTAHAYCAEPLGNAKLAFDEIKANHSVKEFLKTHPVTRTALNEECETLYLASLASGNELARLDLEALGFAPKTAAEINTKLKRFDINTYEYALEYARIEAVIDLKKKLGKLSSENETSQNTELMLAALNPHEEVASYLLRNGADPKATNTTGDTVLMYAAERDDTETFERLVSLGVAVDAVNKSGITALMAAVQNKASVALRRTQLLLKLQANVNQTSSKGWTPLMFAAYAGNFEVGKLLINAGARVEPNAANNTPLLIAINLEKYDFAQYLVDHGANLNARNEKGQTIAHLAVATERMEAIQWAVNAGADLEVVDGKGLTPLLQAVITGQVEIAVFLVGTGANPAAENSLGENALLLAAKSGYAPMIKSLIETGIPVELENKKHEKALMKAATAKCTDALKYLLSVGAWRNSSNRLGWTALHYAAKAGQSEAIKLLLEAEADRSKVSTDGLTAYDLAKTSGVDAETLKLLKP